MADRRHWSAWPRSSAVCGADEGEPAVLLVVDQAEEFVTLAGGSRGRAFLALLHAATRGAGPAVERADAALGVLERAAAVGRRRASCSTTRCWSGRSIARGWPRSSSVRPRAPASTSTPGLVGRMVEDTGGGDALPLLAYTLSELYEASPRRPDRRSPARLRRARRRDRRAAAPRRRRAPAAGRCGLGDAGAAHARPARDAGPEGQPTRRSLPRGGSTSGERQVIDAFLEARLLASGEHDGEAIIEVAHEALLRQWPPLADAIERHRDEPAPARRTRARRRRLGAATSVATTTCSPANGCTRPSSSATSTISSQSAVSSLPAPLTRRTRMRPIRGAGEGCSPQSPRLQRSSPP